MLKRMLSFYILVSGITLSAESINQAALKIQNPRPNGGWVSDGIGYLTDSGANLDINQIITQLEKDTTAEIAIVTLLSIGDHNPKEFANTLFSIWGIGKKEKDNGVLLLHVLDQRRVEIETGYGMEGILPDILCKRILESFIIPNFKAGNFSQGITLGTYAIANAIRHPSFSMNQKLVLEPTNFIYSDLPESHYTNLISNEEVDKIPEAPGILSRHLEDPPHSFKEYFYFWLGILTVISWFFIGGVLSLLPFGNHFLYRIYSFFGGWFSWLAGLSSYCYMIVAEFSESETFYSSLNILPIGISLFFINRWIAKSLRNNPRKCPDCKKLMVKLNEKEEDQHLSAGENTEEEIKSIDYDIWKCRSCNTITKEKYSGTTPASKCRKCNFYTYRCVSTQVKRAATYDNEGEETHIYECAHCRLSEVKNVSIPKLQRASSSSSSSWSSSSSSGGSWSSGGSSGSWGGGSSGGGGAGSSY